MDSKLKYMYIQSKLLYLNQFICLLPFETTNMEESK